MNKAGLEKEVAGHPFLVGLSEHPVRLLVDCAIRTHFESDQIIFREGETANRFYLIETGSVALESTGTGEPVTIEVIGPGDQKRFAVSPSRKTIWSFSKWVRIAQSTSSRM